MVGFLVILISLLVRKGSCILYDVIVRKNYLKREFIFLMGIIIVSNIILVELDVVFYVVKV